MRGFAPGSVQVKKCFARHEEAREDNQHARLSTPRSQRTESSAAEPDPRETDEWIEALDGVISAEGPQRAREIIEALTVRARTRGADIPITLTTPYVNTIPVHAQPPYPGDHDRGKLRHYSRWNAMAMVVRANKHYDGLGGHVATFSSSATLMDVGFNHFWHPPSATIRRRPRLLPRPRFARRLRARVRRRPPRGRAARSFPPRSRRQGAVSSYPHPWLLPDFWQFPTVSMGWDRCRPSIRRAS